MIDSGWFIRRALHLGALSWLASASAACSPKTGPGDVADTDVAEAARWPACDPTATHQVVSFVHMNDMHGHYNIDDAGAANVARIRGYFEQVKAEQPYTLFTNGGDDYEKGSVVEPLSQYAATREISNAMQFDVRVIGNHDLSWSQEELLKYATDPHAIVLASNIEYIGNDPQGYGAVEYAELQIGCVKVGFMGAVSAPWTAENTQYEGDYYPEFPTDLDFVEVHRRLIAEHRADVDLLVAVSHLGVGDDELVADQTDGLDAILGGHSHTPIFEAEDVGGTLIVQAGSYSQFVARLDLDVDLTTRKVVDHTYQLRLTTTDLPADVSTEAEVEGILNHYGPDAFTEIGQFKQGVSKLGASMLAARGAIQDLGVDAAIMKQSAAFAGVKAGPATQQSLFEAFLIERQPPGTPGWTATYTANISGADLARMSELDSNEWAVVLPSEIDPTATYKIALQKYAASVPANYLPAGVTLSGQEFAKETWEILDAWTRARTAACLYADSEDSLPNCP